MLIKKSYQTFRIHSTNQSPIRKSQIEEQRKTVEKYNTKQKKQEIN